MRGPARLLIVCAAVTERPPFHLAFPVDDLAAARDFYVGVLGCGEGRSSARWIDFDLCGHQIVAHLIAPSGDAAGGVGTSPVDGDDVPVRHFGLVLGWDEWHAWEARLRARGVAFLIEPRTRFVGQIGEQKTLFLRDPAGNALEFKTFADPSRLFAADPEQPAP